MEIILHKEHSYCILSLLIQFLNTKTKKCVMYEEKSIIQLEYNNTQHSEFKEIIWKKEPPKT